MSEVDNEAAVAAAREAFFAKLPDPPDNVAVEIVKEAAAGEDAAEAPKAPATRQDTPAQTSPPKNTNDSNGTAVSSPAPVSPTEAVLAALRAGDLDAIADLTGADPADFDETSVRWAARNRRETGLRKEIDRVRTDARAILAQYEPIGTQQEAFDASGGRDWAPVRAIVEHVTGKPWHVAAAQLGVGAPAAAPVRSPAADRVLLEAVRDDVPDDHQVRQLPGWEARVVAVLQEHVDEVTGEPSISFRQAAARAVRRAKEEHARLAPIFGGATAPATPATRAPERADTSAPSARRKLTPEEFYARFDQPGHERTR